MGLRELAIQAMPHVLRQFAVNTADTVPAFIDALERAVCFSFKAEVDQGIYQFGLDLLEHDVFGLPAEVVWFEFYPVPEQKFGILAVAEPFEGTKIVAYGFITDSEATKPTPRDVALCSTVILGDDGRWEVPHLRKGENQELFDKNSNRMLADLIFLVGLLNSKGLERTERPAPEKLNKHRVKAGKPKISSVIEVRVPSSHVYGTAQDAENLRLSPRPHFRRGHVRRAGEKMVMVRPTWVLGEGRHIVPKNYRINRPAASSNPAPLPPASELPVSDDGKPHR